MQPPSPLHGPIALVALLHPAPHGTPTPTPTPGAGPLTVGAAVGVALLGTVGIAAWYVYAVR